MIVTCSIFVLVAKSLGCPCSRSFFSVIFPCDDVRKMRLLCLTYGFASSLKPGLGFPEKGCWRVVSELLFSRKEYKMLLKMGYIDFTIATSATSATSATYQDAWHMYCRKCELR